MYNKCLLKQMKNQLKQEQTQLKEKQMQPKKKKLKLNQLLGERGKKTSVIWKDFDEKEITKGVFRAVCKHSKA